MFLVSSNWNVSLYLFLCRSMCLRPFGLYCKVCFGILFVSILCTGRSHFSWYCSISFTIFSASVFSLIHWYFSLSILYLIAQKKLFPHFHTPSLILMKFGTENIETMPKFQSITGHESPEREWRYSYTLSLTSALDCGQRHAPAALPLRKRPVTHFIRGCVCPRACLDRCGKSRPPQRFDLWTLQLLASSYNDWAIPAPSIQCRWSYMGLVIINSGMAATL
jgi:hypothetical protein